MTEPILADSIIPIRDANIPHEVLPETTKSILEDENITVPLKSPLFKRKHKTIHTHNDTEYNLDEKKKKNTATLPIYHSKFNDLIKSYTTNKTTIDNHKKIVDDILELYIKHGQNKVSEYTVRTVFFTDTYPKTLLQYSIDCALNVVNSRDIIFYHDKIRDLFCAIAFLSNLGLILGGGNAWCSDSASKYLRENGWPELICKLVDNVFPIMAYHSSNDNIKCIQEIIDGLRENENIDTLEYKELSLVIHKCMQTKVCNTREQETECYLYEYIRQNLINVLQSF
jgi:hypothetical protein